MEYVRYYLNSLITFFFFFILHNFSFLINSKCNIPCSILKYMYYNFRNNKSVKIFSKTMKYPTSCTSISTCYLL